MGWPSASAHCQRVVVNFAPGGGQPAAENLRVNAVSMGYVQQCFTAAISTMGAAGDDADGIEMLETSLARLPLFRHLASRDALIEANREEDAWEDGRGSRNLAFSKSWYRVRRLRLEFPLPELSAPAPRLNEHPSLAT